MRASCLIFFAACSLCSITPLLASAADFPREISVHADAEVRKEADTVQVTISLQSKGGGFSEANNSLSLAWDSLLSEIRTLLGDSVSVRTVETAHTGSNGSFSGTDQVLESRRMILETTKGKSSNQLLDLLRKKTSIQILSISEVVSDSESSKREAIAVASRRAKERAEIVARELGARLGTPLSVVVTEDPAGAILLQQRQAGAERLTSTEEATRVTVTVRFGIQ